MEDLPKTGRRAIVDHDRIKATIEDNPIITATELYNELGLGRTTITGILNNMGLININKMWVPKSQPEDLIKTRISTCDALLNRYNADPFLDRTIFEGERVIYYNIRRRHKNRKNEHDMERDIKTMAKSGVKPYKVVLHVWWDRQGVIFYKLIGEKSFSPDDYLLELTHLRSELAEKRPLLDQSRIIIHHNSTQHLTEEVNQEIRSLGWEQIFHPKLCPDFSPTNYCLFQNLQYSLHLQFYTQLEEVEQFVYNFFDSRKSSFFREGIDILPNRWCTIINRSGEFIETNEKI